MVHLLDLPKKTTVWKYANRMPGEEDGPASIYNHAVCPKHINNVANTVGICDTEA